MSMLNKFASKLLITGSVLSLSITLLEVSPAQSAVFDFSGNNGIEPSLGIQEPFVSTDMSTSLDVFGFKNIIPSPRETGNISSNLFGLGIIEIPPTAPIGDPDTQVIQRRLGRSNGIIEGLEFVFANPVTLDSIDFIADEMDGYLGSQFSLLVDGTNLVEDPNFTLPTPESTVPISLTGSSFLVFPANNDSAFRIRGLEVNSSSSTSVPEPNFAWGLITVGTFLVLHKKSKK